MVACLTLNYPDTTDLRGKGIVIKVDGVVNNSSSITVENNHTISFTPPDGKEFFLDSDYYVSFRWTQAGQSRQCNWVTLNSDGKTVSLFMDAIYNGSSPTTTFNRLINLRDAIPTIKPLSWVTNPNSAVTGSSTVFSWKDGVAPFFVVVKAPDGSTFYESGAISATNYALDVPLRGQVGTYTITVKDSYDPVGEINNNVLVSAKEFDYVVSSSDISNFNDAHATLQINGVLAVIGSGAYYGDVLTAYANNGYEFIRNSSQPVTSVYMRTNILGQLRYQAFTLSDDNKIATYTIYAPSANYSWQNIFCSTTQSTSAYGSNSVYLIDDNILSEVNGARFKTSTSASGESTVFDYGQFILSVLQLPFNIPADMILEPEDIKLATLNTGVKAKKLSSDKINIDLGSIVIPEPSSMLDYIGVTCLLHLPRIDPINIDLDYVIGCTLSITYSIDCYTGVATVNIKSSKINDVIVTKKVNIGVDIPYANTMNGRSVDNTGIDVGGDNGVTKPYVELVKQKIINPHGFFTIPVVDEMVLGDNLGYTVIDAIDLAVKAPFNEKSEIVNILNRGVIIK